MPQQTHSSPTAVAYATALLELANERKQTQPIKEELSGLRQILGENPSFRAFLSDPSVGDVGRTEALKRIFAGKLTPLFEHFLEVVASKERLGALSQIADAYDHLLDEQMGKIEVDITVAQKLMAEQLEEARKRISAALKKDAVVHQYVDESIIGGLILRVRDQLIDASVKSQITALRQQLLAARPQ